MAADLTPLITKIQNTDGVLDSALAYVQGSAARMKTAVDAALANGATAEQLAPVTAEVDAQAAKAQAVADAIVANP